MSSGKCALVHARLLEFIAQIRRQLLQQPSLTGHLDERRDLSPATVGEAAPDGLHLRADDAHAALLR